MSKENDNISKELRLGSIIVLISWLPGKLAMVFFWFSFILFYLLL
jgi:hypothetical protein